MSLTMATELSPPEGTLTPLTKKQLKGVDLRAEGDSWDQIAKKLEVHPRTICRWRQHPLWDSTLKQRQAEWVEEYEARFKKMLPRAAHTHNELLMNESAAIRMRAVDSCHQHYARNVKEQEVRSEVEELKEMVKLLIDQLAQERAKG